MSTEKQINDQTDDQQVLGPIILTLFMGLMIICAWAFARPNAFKRPDIDVQLTENVDSENVNSQTEEIQLTETLETETTKTTTIETKDAETTTTIETKDAETTTTAKIIDKPSKVNIETTTSTAIETTTSTQQPTANTIETTTSSDTEQPTTDKIETTTNTIESTAASQAKPETASGQTDIVATSDSQGKYLTEAKTLGQIKFEINEVELSSPAKQTVNSLIPEINKYDPNRVTIKVEGHTSRVGDAQLNKEISQDRANVVVAYLKEKNLPHQVISEGMGYSQPLPNSNPASDINQRTVIILIPAN
ncbi:MAG: OmpA family protein [Trichodesmium sp. St16_bin4-tuft]|nr:OmpA family protein [Trichodesmium sp. St4_bin8_1]MDE5072793.1 OmpA family protein [Trichodesmium sp. St5_bin8]MDE5079340.1 OmpA family protein [Trichodesmium sp. St2_bin6]MDE5091945.1 OmpA family protein [Trichodesmium sp. St18_bin3_1_1]MDE5098778.1 OmpA family protein [Trichodesmium sp. St16_bin4-tuft]MDE5103667.1 OmpA family protein [Trichodesmium sp. St19_bin2]